MISRQPTVSIFEGKFMLFIKSHGPINAPSGQEKPERVGFNWDIPPATFTWKDGILETDGNHLGIFPELGPGRSLFHIPWISGVGAQKVGFEARGRGYMMRINAVPVFVKDNVLCADEEQRVRRRLNPALFEVLPPLDD